MNLPLDHYTTNSDITMRYSGNKYAGKRNSHNKNFTIRNYKNVRHEVSLNLVAQQNLYSQLL